MKTVPYYLILVIILLFMYYSILFIEKFINNNYNNLIIVISRYNENLQWVNTKPFSNYEVICYNKGINQNFKIEQKHQIINLPNLGREYHTYLYYIYNNYDKLPDVILFLPGSLDLEHKMNKALQIINNINNMKKVYIFGDLLKIKTNFYDFVIDEYGSTHNDNKLIDNGSRFTTPCSTRPFGKWVEEKLGDKNIGLISYYGVAILTKEIIHKNPKEYYKQFIDELEVSSNPEVGHFMERAFYLLFDIPDNMKDLYSY
jgi:hypothetical protein